MYYASQWPDLVAGIVVWFPANSFIKNVPGFADRLQVPVLMFAGEKDHYRDNCCTANGARSLAAAAKAAGKPFELFTYDKAEHDFVRDGAHYNAEADTDAFQKTPDKLKQWLPGAVRRVRRFQVSGFRFQVSGVGSRFTVASRCQRFPLPVPYPCSLIPHP